MARRRLLPDGVDDTDRRLEFLLRQLHLAHQRVQVRDERGEDFLRARIRRAVHLRKHGLRHVFLVLDDHPRLRGNRTPSIVIAGTDSCSSVWKRATTWSSRSASSWKDRDLAAAASTSAAFCCVTVSSCMIALLISPTPELCSADAAAISPIRLLPRCTLATISSMTFPAAADCRLPSDTCATDCSMSALISLAAAALRCASARTSLATTAKPRPCSPARAASTAAFSARMLVWNAMPSIVLMISAMRLEPWSMLA